MSTRATVVLASVVSAVLIAVIAAVATFVVIQKQHADDVEAADAAAAAYAEDVEDFRERAAEELERSVSIDAAESLEAAEDLEGELPELAGAPSYGRENSDAYAEAQQTRRQLADDVTTLVESLQRWVDVTAFVSAGYRALDRGAPADLIGPGPFEDGQPVRDTAVPGMQALRDAFVTTEVPEGLDDAAEAVTTALDFVLAELETMAASLDRGQSYSFQFGAQYQTAADALRGAEDEAREPVDEALATVVEG